MGKTATSSAPQFVVEDHGQPHLDTDDQVQPTPGDDTGAAAPVAEVIQPEEVWTADEAQAFLHNIWNLGFWFYGVDWLAQPFDMKRSSPDAAWVLDRLLPKSIGGPVGWTIKLSNLASDVGMSVAIRREVLKRGPRSPAENMAELMKRYGVEPGTKAATGEPSESPAAPPVPPPAQTSTPWNDPLQGRPKPPKSPSRDNGDGFAFSSEERASLNNFPDGSAWTEAPA